MYLTPHVYKYYTSDIATLEIFTHAAVKFKFGHSVI